MKFAIGAALFIGFGLAQLVAAFQGADYHLGTGWAITTILLCLLTKISLPIVIASFFGAKDVWEWHWALAALFASPGLLLIIPSILASITEQLTKVVRR